MTATGSYNLWDELILSEELKFLQNHYGEMADFTIFTHDQKSSFVHDSSVHFVSYFPNNISKNFLGNIGYFFKNIWLILRADIIIIGWGGLIFDNEPGVNFDILLAQWYFRVKLARISGAAIVFLGLSIEVKNTKNKMKLGKIFKQGDFIILRDEKSVGILDALGIASSYIPDIVFLHEPKKLEKLPPKKRVGISVRGGFLWDTERVIPEIYEFLEKSGYDPVFLIHTATGEDSQNDALFIKRIMTGKTYNVTGSIEHTLNLYPSLHAVIGMRFHSSILACIYELPFLMISYGPKTDELIKLLECDNFMVRPETLSIDIFTKLWNELEANYDARKEHLRIRHQQIREDLTNKLLTL